MVRGLLLLAALLGSGRVWGAQVLVLNSAAASLSVVDLGLGREVKRIPALREPHHLVLRPDGSELLVGDTAGNELLMLDPVSFAVRRRVPMADPYQLGFSPDGSRLVVTGLARNQVDVYRADTLALEHRFPVSSTPSHLDFSPDGSRVFVSLQGTDRLVAIDLARMVVAWTMPVGRTPAGVMWHAAGVLVANMGADDVAVVDPENGVVRRRIRTGAGAHTLFRSPDGSRIYVNNRVAGSTTAIDATTLAVLRTYSVPGGPDDIVFAPDGRLLITQRFSRGLAVLEPDTGAVSSIPVGRSPHGLFLGLAR